MVASYDSLGASRFPLTPTDDIQAGIAYDRGLRAIIDLAVAAVEADVGDAWRQQTRQLDPSSKLYESETPIATVIEYMPDPQNLTQVSNVWPILAVYREGEAQTEQQTIEYPVFTQQWGLDWIVGPLGPDAQRKIGHFWVQIRNAIWVAMKLGHHWAYQNGAYQFFGIFSELNPVSASGPAISQHLTGQGGSGYFGGSIVLQTKERLVFQSKAQADTFNAGPYLTPHDGYGTEISGADVDVHFDNMTPHTD